MPDTILSDQGSQFKPVIDILQHNYENDINWKKIPGKSPWFGAPYERVIGITKNAIDRTFHNSAMSHTLFRTALFEIEQVINSRPITYVENDIGFEPLTPNHFLTIPDTIEEKETNTSVIKSDRAHLQALWKYMNNIRQQFGHAWSQQYLPLLRERHSSDGTHTKAATTKKQLQIGEIVLVAQKNIKRKHWQLAKIIDLPVSADNQIRSATLELGSHTIPAKRLEIISRPIQDIYPLEIDESTPTTTEDDAVSEISIELDDDF